MSAIKICQNSDGILDLEIRPGKKYRALRIFVFVFAGTGLLYALFQLGIPALKILPLWLIPFVSLLIVVLAGWNGWVWHSRGFEKLRVSLEFFSYERHGSFFDCKKKEIPTNEITDILIYKSPGIGNNAIPSRLCVSSSQGRLRIGRELSHTDAVELKRLLQSFISDHRRS
jgi:hypothetical protein